jgi:hypothetical protein
MATAVIMITGNDTRDMHDTQPECRAKADALPRRPQRCRSPVRMTEHTPPQTDPESSRDASATGSINSSQGPFSMSMSMSMSIPIMIPRVPKRNHNADPSSCREKPLMAETTSFVSDALVHAISRAKEAKKACSNDSTEREDATSDRWSSETKSSSPLANPPRKIRRPREEEIAFKDLSETEGSTSTSALKRQDIACGGLPFYKKTSKAGNGPMPVDRWTSSSALRDLRPIPLLESPRRSRSSPLDYYGYEVINEIPCEDCTTDYGYEDMDLKGQLPGDADFGSKGVAREDSLYTDYGYEEMDLKGRNPRAAHEYSSSSQKSSLDDVSKYLQELNHVSKKLEALEASLKHRGVNRRGSACGRLEGVSLNRKVVAAKPRDSISHLSERSHSKRQVVSGNTRSRTRKPGRMNRRGSACGRLEGERLEGALNSIPEDVPAIHDSEESLILKPLGRNRSNKGISRSRLVSRGMNRRGSM